MSDVRAPRQPEAFRTEVVIDAPPDHVFRHWIDADLLASWLGIRAEVDARPGGVFRFEVAPGEWCSGTYLEIDPPHRLAVSWGWESGRIDPPPGSTRVDITLHAEDGGTRLVLVHHGLGQDVLRLHADGWPRFLGRLAAVTTGADPGADPGVESPEQALTRLDSP